jgi:hypothetical protein
MDRDRLALVKIRQPRGKQPKYVEVFRDRPTIYPTPEAVRPGMPLIVCEGELDCLLLTQALGELAAVVTLGSASSKPEGAIYLAMLRCPRWYVATDADPAGDKAASGWPARAIRVRPPDPYKDWTDARKGGIDLRPWWIDRLDATDAPDPPDPAPSKVPPSGVVEPSTPSPSETEAPAIRPLWPPRPPELAGWPIAWRERWGRLANSLQDQGVLWPDYERLAFERTKAEVEAGTVEPLSPPEASSLPAAECPAMQGTLFTTSSVQNSGLRGGTL